MKQKHILGIIISIMFIGCTISTNKTITNNLEDKWDAEEITEKFYAYQKENKLDDMIGLFSTDYFKKSTKLDLADRLDKYRNKLGTLKKHSLENWETKIEKGNNSSSSYFFVYKNEYTNYNVTETFKMTKEQFGRIRITDYKLEIK